MSSSKKTKDPLSNSLEEALIQYNRLHPNFEFHQEFPEKDKLNTLIASRGRKNIFAKVNNDLRAFYEDSEEEMMDIPSWNKLIGCGG